MENLRLLDYRSIKLAADIENLRSFHLDDNLCCFVTSLYELFIQDINEKITITHIPKELRDDIVHINYQNIWNIIVIVTTSNLIVYDITTEKFHKMSCLNSDTKIVQASWNPIQNFVVLIDNLGFIFGYSFSIFNESEDNYTFALINHGSLEDKIPNSVYVGWGAHNTQFKGSKKNKEVVQEILLEYSTPIISWRGNGEMFVINYWKDNRRFLKVFDANLHPLFGSEPYNNLLAPTSFKGQGSFIACAATDGETNRILIYEKNCMIKSSVCIPENKGEIKGVQYHPEKHILAVHSESTIESCLNIYLYANGIWHLKQQLCIPNVLKFRWLNDLNTTCRINILTSQNFYLYEYSLETYGVSNDLVAVINGPKVFFTQFSEEIIPSPMASINLQFEKPINRINFYPLLNIYDFIMSDGRSHKYKYENEKFTMAESEIPKEKSEISTNNMLLYQNNNYQIMLDQEQNLIINEKIISKNVLSVHVHENYLLFTKLHCEAYKLFSFRLTDKNISSFNLETLFAREVEQGAKIVSVTNKNQVILALPRGNLETITCRLIAIDAIDKLLSQNLWDTAIKQIRSQKLNWNLLIDLNKQRFIEHIKDFIIAANTVSLLNVIVTEFSIENCLQTMYKVWSRQETLTKQYLEKDGEPEIPKIKILSAILKILIQLNPIVNLYSIVILQIKHFSIKAALKSILHAFELKQLEVCRKAITQILRYKHSKDIICAAYTLYNIDFVSFIYSSCSEDPRVFEPEIKELQTLNPIDLRFSMNVRGKEFENATKYLVRSETKNELFISDFIKKYSTQKMAYNNVQTNDRHFEIISLMYADYLGLRTRHNEAGWILERAGLYQDAITRYKIAHNWHKVLSLLNVLNIEGEAKITFLRSFAQDLINVNQVEEGARIYEQYCNDYKSAIVAFTTHKMFQKAICLARQYNSKELIENVIKPSLKNYREDTFERISELETKFNDYVLRLLQIRKNKCKKLIRKQMINEGIEFEMDDAEFETDPVGSEYGSIISRSSMGSLGSAGSKSSSRSLRRLERKKINLREGGTFEDIALIRQLYMLAMDIFGATQEVTEICLSLIDEENFKYGKMLEKTLHDLKTKVLNNIPVIWSDVFLNAENSSDPSVIAVIENRHELGDNFHGDMKNTISQNELTTKILHNFQDEQFRLPPRLQIQIESGKLMIC